MLWMDEIMTLAVVVIRNKNSFGLKERLALIYVFRFIDVIILMSHSNVRSYGNAKLEC